MAKGRRNKIAGQFAARPIPMLESPPYRVEPRSVDHGRRSSFGQGKAKEGEAFSGQSPALRHQTLGRRA
jgi:hypothetical protein